MDPNKNLRMQLEIAKELQNDHGDICARAEQLAELVLALDNWMRSGGFAPVRWGVR